MKKYSLIIALLIIVGLSPHIFASQDNYGYDCPDVNPHSGLAINGAQLSCFNEPSVTGGQICWVYIWICGDFYEKAKYRIHFDTEEPYAKYSLDCNADPDHGFIQFGDGTKQVTGPPYYAWETYDWSDTDPYDYGQKLEVFYYPSTLGLAPGDSLFAWVDVQYKGVQDQVPPADDADGCAKPQNSDEVLEVTVPLPVLCETPEQEVCGTGGNGKCINGECFVEVTAASSLSGNQVCANEGLVCADVPPVSPREAACKAFHPTASVTSSSSGWQEAVYCNSAAGAACGYGSKTNNCHYCPACGDNIECTHFGGPEWTALYARCIESP